MDSAQPVIPGPFPAEEMERFLASYYYDPIGFLIDEVRRIDAHEVEAVMDTSRHAPFAELRGRGAEPGVRSVSWPAMVMLSGSLGALHAYFVHGCRWDEGWVGFANRIHHADFRRFALPGPPLDLHLLEVRSRLGERRLVSRYHFQFEQDGRVAYEAEQTTQYLRRRTGS